MNTNAGVSVLEGLAVMRARILRFWALVQIPPRLGKSALDWVENISTIPAVAKQ
ncbi:hypothetical protein LJR290_006871 [Variovorax sp. LjRoot290]|uniref:hypothetical protein n=1 Tax=Variovorax sp. LjRoot290 TaxID=3342316 RepID=UPI003ECF0F47